LVVIAIIAILAVVVVLTLNPAELLRQSRDANRLSDLATLSSAINLYTTDQSGASGFSLGNPASSYLSIPDTTSTCANIGFASGNVCVSATSSRNIDGTGWIPLSFKNISTGSPLSSLPLDPSNTSSSGLYHTYSTTGSTYQLIAAMESQKYKQSVVGPLGNGIDVQGSSVGQGPVGWWKFDEGVGSSTIDASGNNNNGTWSGTAAGTNGTYYATGKVGSWAGYFDGTSTYITTGKALSAFMSVSNGTILSWIYPVSGNGGGSSGTASPIIEDLPNSYVWLGYNGTNIYAGGYDTSNKNIISAITPNQWILVSWVHSAGTLYLYVNGLRVGTTTLGNISNLTGSVSIGRNYAASYFFSGLIDNTRIYNRALSAAEIQAIYNTEK
jgi:type II secretory pathway pseudopilin PulG